MRSLLTALLLLCFAGANSQVVFSTRAAAIKVTGLTVDTIPKNQHLVTWRLHPAANDTLSLLEAVDDQNNRAVFSFTQTTYSSAKACYDAIFPFCSYKNKAANDLYNINAQPTYRGNHYGYQPLATISQSGAQNGQVVVWRDSNWVAETVSGSSGSIGPTGSTGPTGATGATGTTVPNALTFSYGITGATSYDGSVAQTIKADTSTSGINLATQGYADRGDVWVLLSTVTASNSATVDFTGLSSDYDNYEVVIDNIVPSTNSTDFWVRVGIGGTPTYQTGSVYNYVLHFGYYNGTSVAGVAGAFSANQIAVATANNVSNISSLNVEVMIYDPSQTATHHVMDIKRRQVQTITNTSTVTIGDMTCAYASTTAVTAIRFQMSSGDISTGTFKLYGIK